MKSEEQRAAYECNYSSCDSVLVAVVVAIVIAIAIAAAVRRPTNSMITSHRVHSCFFFVMPVVPIETLVIPNRNER